MFHSSGLKKPAFEQAGRQIIYTEGRYLPEINDFIRRNYLELRRAFNEKSFDFCYIPLMQQELLTPAINYYAPYTGKSENDIKLGNDLILDFMVFPENKEKIPPSLLFYSKWTRVNYPEADDQYRGFILDVQDALSEKDDALRDGQLPDVFTDVLNAIIEHISSKTIHFMRRSYEVQETLSIADEDFDSCHACHRLSVVHNIQDGPPCLLLLLRALSTSLKGRKGTTMFKSVSTIQ